MNRTFGAEVRHHRERRGVGEAEVAQALGVSVSSLRSLEADSRPPTPREVARYAEMFQLKREHLWRSAAQTIGVIPVPFNRLTNATQLEIVRVLSSLGGSGA